MTWADVSAWRHKNTESTVMMADKPKRAWKTWDHFCQKNVMLSGTFFTFAPFSGQICHDGGVHSSSRCFGIPSKIMI
ncbi:hypothetical protein [Allorhizobium sonneratiae]|uniref:hypothetical protein n=1 Tax=Allorhizobium sonneratiae TaxID=2934936 RepID=UPI00203382CD|nr:hypothetical protein [Allorhizobium sonneratiae]